MYKQKSMHLTRPVQNAKLLEDTNHRYIHMKRGGNISKGFNRKLNVYPPKEQRSHEIKHQKRRYKYFKFCYKPHKT